MEQYAVIGASVLVGISAVSYLATQLANAGWSKLFAVAAFPFTYAYHATMLVAGVVVLHAALPFVFVLALASEAWQTVKRIPGHFAASWHAHEANVNAFAALKEAALTTTVTKTFG